MPEPKPRIVEVVKSSYQPTKVELEEEISLEVSGTAVLERMEAFADAVLRPVRFRRISNPDYS